MLGLRIWAMAARWMARLSWRLPPRLSRWRTVRPLLASMDSAGENAAKKDTLVHTLGNKNILRTAEVCPGSVSKPEIEDLLRAPWSRSPTPNLTGTSPTLQQANPTGRSPGSSAMR